MGTSLLSSGGKGVLGWQVPYVSCAGALCGLERLCVLGGGGLGLKF